MSTFSTNGTVCVNEQKSSLSCFWSDNAINAPNKSIFIPIQQYCSINQSSLNNNNYDPVHMNSTLTVYSTLHLISLCYVNYCFFRLFAVLDRSSKSKYI